MVNILQERLFSEMSTQEQREFLQAENPDKLAGVFDIKIKFLGDFEIITIPNILACYPNQLEDEQIKLPDDFGEGKIVIVNMGALRKGEIEVIAGNSDNLGDIKKPCLLSPGVIEYWEDEESGKKYTQTVLRDGGKMNTSAGITTLADANERTTTAGRNFSGKLNEDLEIENAEESPFLMQDESGKYVLVTHDLKYKEHLIASIRNFLENKYLQPEQEGYTEVKKAFERKFKGVTYEELGAILATIIESDSFAEYTWTEGNIEGLNIDNIKLEGTDGNIERSNFYIYHDEANNTIEYRAIRRITGFPEGLKAVGRIPLRLFLESQNQDPQFRKVENVGVGGTKLVPTIDEVSKRVRATL